MTEINSNKVLINNSDRNIFNFLSDFNNFEKLMPEQVINWQSTTDTCSFTIKGMAELGMKISECVEFSKIQYDANGKVPFNFSMSWHLYYLNNQTEAQLKFNADLNPMLKLMATKPLQNFLNMLVVKLKEIMEG